MALEMFFTQVKLHPTRWLWRQITKSTPTSTTTVSVLHLTTQLTARMKLAATLDTDALQEERPSHSKEMSFTPTESLSKRTARPKNSQSPAKKISQTLSPLLVAWETLPLAQKHQSAPLDETEPSNIE